MKSGFPQIRAERIKEARELAGLSQDELAKRLCLSKAHIDQLENNRDSIFFSIAHKIAIARKVGMSLGLKESDCLYYNYQTQESSTKAESIKEPRYPFDENSVSLFKKLKEASQKIKEKLLSF